MSVVFATRGGRAHGRTRLSASIYVAPDKSVRELKHSAASYRSGICKCEFCMVSHAATQRNRRSLRRAGVDISILSRAEKQLLAKRFLDDGATYREAAATVRTGEKELALALPGYEQNAADWNSIMAGIKRSDTLLPLHREIWHGTRYNEKQDWVR